MGHATAFHDWNVAPSRLPKVLRGGALGWSGGSARAGAWGARERVKTEAGLSDEGTVVVRQGAKRRGPTHPLTQRTGAGDGRGRPGHADRVASASGVGGASAGVGVT